MSKRRARLAVIGLGAAGRKHVDTVAHRLPNAELAMFVEMDDTVAAEYSRDLGVPRGTYEEVLERTDIDGVILATPTPMHPRMVIDAAHANKHVFSEKPLGLDLAEQIEAVAEAEKAGVLLQVGFVRRFQPEWREAHRLVNDGAIGDVYLFSAGQRERIPYQDASHLKEVGNFFADVMVHEFDLARWMVGEVAEVNAWGASPTVPALESAGDAQVTCVQLRFAGGALGILDGTMLSAHGYDCYTELLGQEGAVRVGYTPRTADVLTQAAGEARVPFPSDFRVRFDQGFVGELHHFATAILDETPPEVGGREALAAFEIAMAATESFRSGTPVAVNDVGVNSEVA